VGALLALDGYRNLTSGQPITFTYETPGQDDHPHRALSVRAHKSRLICHSALTDALQIGHYALPDSAV
jgi:hypothetical protein